MEPIDRRTTAARLVSLRGEPNAGRLIAELLGVSRMAALDAVRTAEEIDRFIESGDATQAAQLIHSASVRAARPIAP